MGSVKPVSVALYDVFRLFSFKQDERFHLPGKKALHKTDTVSEVVLVDATECPCERPKKQRCYYSGKKKRHTQKVQLLADKQTGKILAMAFCTGKMHDFALFVRSRTVLLQQASLLADGGYQGIAKYHQNSKASKKRNKLHLLS